MTDTEHQLTEPKTKKMEKVRACQKPSRDTYATLSKEAKKKLHQLEMGLRAERRVEYARSIRRPRVMANLSVNHPKWGQHPTQVY